MPHPISPLPASQGYSPQGSRREYARRFNRVLDHIDQHLGEPLDLSGLAQVACFSPYHFHRLFAAWMGETLGDYLRRRRLEVAALKLAHQPERPVLDIALTVGFGSSEAFARAFKLRFGQSPSAWRASAPARWQTELNQHRARRFDQQGNPDQAHSNPDQAPTGPGAEDGGFPPLELPMNVTLETLTPARVAYVRHIGPYGPTIHRLWMDTVLPWRAAQGLEQAPCYGIGYDDPAITPPEKCRYDACVAVPPDFVAQAPMGLTDLPGGRYAVALFEGSMEAFAGAWTELLRDWLPASGMALDARPFFEYYDHTAHYDPATGTIRCKICIPVRAL